MRPYRDRPESPEQHNYRPPISIEAIAVALLLSLIGVGLYACLLSYIGSEAL